MIDDQRIRVLHVAHGLGLGGTEKTMQLLAAHLDQGSFLPCLFAFEDGPRRRLMEASGLRVMTGGDLFALLERFRPHIVHVHRAGWPDRGIMRPLLLHRGKRTLPRIVETNVFGRFDPLPDGRAVDLHLFVSRFCLERYRRHHPGPWDPARHAVLYNPVDVDFFARHCPEDGGASGRGASAGRLSRPDLGKWSPLAWEFVPHVVRELPEFRYSVVGVVDEARRFFREQGLERHVEYLPPIEDEQGLAAFFNSVSLLAHANDTGESFGLVIAEAMAAGLPVVTHPCLGERDNAQLELVEHGVTGLVAADAAAYAEAVLRLLRRPEEARAMGRAGRDKAARLYAAPVLARRLESLYSSLLQGV